MSVIQLYDQMAEGYTQVTERVMYAVPKWLEGALPRFVTSQPTHVADLACANGLLGKILRTHFPQAEITGIDISPRMLEQAEPSGFYDRLILHDLNEPIKQYFDTEVDLIVGFGFTEFLNHPLDLLTGLCGLLSDQGTLMLSFQEYEPNEPTKAPRTTNSGTVIHHAYSVSEIESMFDKAGMHLLDLEHIVGYQSGSGFLCPYLIAVAKRG